MKRVLEIREALSHVGGAFADFPVDWAAPGPDEAVRSLWCDSAAALDAKQGVTEPREAEDQYDEPGPLPDLEDLFEIGAEVDRDSLESALGGPSGAEIRRSIALKGIDPSLGAYLSFHCRGAQCGIYIRTSALCHLAEDVFGGLALPLANRLKIALRAIHQHELFHFAVDYMAAQWEAITQKPCWLPARSLKHPTSGYNLLEEELANAHMMRAFWGGPKPLKAKGRADCLREFVLRQPPGYRDAPRSVATPAFVAAASRLAFDYVGCIPGLRAPAFGALDAYRMFPLADPLDWRYCPVHIIEDSHRLGLPPLDLELFREVAGITESKQFSKALASFPPSLRRQWQRTKEKLAISTALPGLDFKRWRRAPDGDVYSVRITLNYRAHLHYASGSWVAEAVGPHKAMGHG